MSKKTQPCILVVEDERAIRDMLVAFLKTGGFTNVVTAGNAEEAAFYIFKDAGLTIQLALVDLVLPNANGLTLIRKIRNAKAQHRRKLPVIVLTGRTDTDTYRAAARRGIQAYLMKPVSASLLVETVNKVLYPDRKTAPEAAAETGPAPEAPPALDTPGDGVSF